MQPSEELRACVLNVAIDAAVRPLLDGHVLFSEILGGQNVEELERWLHSLRGKRLGRRFLEVCYRHNDPNDWSAFLAHELKKDVTPRTNDVVEHFQKKLPEWWTSTDSDSLISQLLQNELHRFLSVIGAWNLRAEEYQRWRLTLLRRVIKHALQEEVS